MSALVRLSLGRRIRSERPKKRRLTRHVYSDTSFLYGFDKMLKVSALQPPTPTTFASLIVTGRAFWLGRMSNRG